MTTLLAPQNFGRTDEQSSSVGYAWDASTGVVVLSGACVQVLGVTEGAHTTERQVVPAVDPADIPRLQTTWAGLTPERSAIEISHRIAHPDRGVVWVETHGRAAFDGAGRMLRITGTVEDMTERIQLEIQRATADGLLHLALEAGRSVGWDWDVRSGRDVWFGDLQTMFGIPSTTNVGHVDDFRRRVHPEDRELVWTAVRDSMRQRTPYAAEFRVVRPDGAVRSVAAQGRFHFSADGEPLRMLGIAADITERKVTSEALHRKDIELAEAQRLAGVGSWQWDIEHDIVSWSDELYRIAGRDPTLPAVTFSNHDQLYMPESWERLRIAVEAALRSGVPYELDLEMVRADGAVRWVIARGEAQRDASDRVVGLRGTVQDIHERRRSEQALRENEERLRLAAQAGRVYATEWDVASGVIFRSAEFMQVLGLSSEHQQTNGPDIIATVHPDDRAKISAAALGTSPQDPAYRVQYRMFRADNSVVWLEASGLALFDRTGTMYRTLGMVADITEHKRAEEAISVLSRRLIEAQETERARIARDLHDDIGQRLALTLVTLESAKPAAVKNAIRRHLEDIARSVHNLSHELHAPTLRYLGIAKAIRGFCTQLAERQQVDINFSHHDLPKTVPQDVSLCLFRVVQEALHNAIRHSKVRRFDVELRGAPDAVSLVVRDDGVGFDPEKARKGSGLGLISMHERLKLVNGALSIDSRRKGGTAIHARVPLSSTAPAPPAA